MRKTAFLLLLPAALLTLGTFGYWLLEPGWTLFDGLYMSVITLTTVGYGEIPAPLSIPGRSLTIFLLLGGVYTLLYVANESLRALASGEYHSYWKERKMLDLLAQMKNHVIVVGHGRMGAQICQSLVSRGQHFVVVDRDNERLASAKYPGGISLPGEGGNDDILRKAGINRARALVAATGSDADNLFVVMSARLLNSHVTILARADHETNEAKMTKAGANQVIRPFVVGGSIMADLILKPNVIEFLRFATGSANAVNDFVLEEIGVMAGSELDGARILADRWRETLGISIIGYRRDNGPIHVLPQDETCLKVGDVLIALGSRQALGKLENKASSN